MATIFQINRIATNRPNAVSDVVNRLQSTTEAVVNIRERHLPLDRSRFTIDGTTGLISPNPQAVNLSDVQTYTTTTLRNAATNITWHTGDVAIVTGPTTTTGAFTDSTYTALAFPSSTTVRLSSGSWDASANAAVGIAVDDVIQFRTSAGIIAGSTTGGTDFTVRNVARFLTTDQALITIDRGTFPTDGVSPLPSSGDQIWIQGTGGTIPANTYIYTGTDQTSPGTTDDDDWTILVTPTAMAPITLPTTKTAQTASLDIDPTVPTGVTINGDDVTFDNTLFTYTAGEDAADAVMFPTAPTTVFEVYIDGLKISSNEIATGRTNTNFTLTGARPALVATGNFVVEIVWRD